MAKQAPRGSPCDVVFIFPLLADADEYVFLESIFSLLDSKSLLYRVENLKDGEAISTLIQAEANLPESIRPFHIVCCFNNSVAQKVAVFDETEVHLSGLPSLVADEGFRQVFVGLLLHLITSSQEAKLKKISSQYSFLYELEDIESFLEEMPRISEDWTYDIESPKLPPYHKNFIPYTISLSPSDSKSYAFGLFHPQAKLRKCRGEREGRILQKFCRNFQDPRYHWSGHNFLKFDRYGIEIPFRIRMFRSTQDVLDRSDDTMVMRYTLDEAVKGHYGLKPTAWDFLQIPNWGISCDDLASVPLPDVLKYNAFDSAITRKLRGVLHNALVSDSSIYGVDLVQTYRQVYFPNALNAGILDRNGAQSNVPYSFWRKDWAYRSLDKLEKYVAGNPYVMGMVRDKIAADFAARKRIPTVGTPAYDAFLRRIIDKNQFRTGSQEEQVLLYEKMQIPYPEQFGRTKKGNDVRVTLEVLEFLASKEGGGHKICRALLRISEIKTELSSYILPVIKNRELTFDGLSHSSFLYHGTETARYSCKNADDPGSTGVGENLQKISRKEAVKNLYTSRFPSENE